MKNQPTWTEVKINKRFPKLEQNLATEVVVIGGGLAGLLTAYVLGEQGKEVVIVEADRLVSGATAMTTAFLTQMVDTDPQDLISMFGKKDAQLIWQSHGQAIDLIERIIKAEKIDCEWKRCSSYSYINNSDEHKDLTEQYQATKQLLSTAQLRKKISGFPNSGAIELPNQAKFHPTKFAKGLVKALQKFPVRIFEQTEVKEVSGSGPVKVKTAKHTIEADWAIIATYDPLNNPPQTFMKKGMYVSYVYELKIPKGLFKEALYEDSNNPYHYFRIDRAGRYDRMILGGEDNRKELAFDEQKNFKALKAYAKKLLGKNEFEVTRKWRGPILEPSDGLALIGELEAGRLVATAFSGNGMTYSAIAAMVFRDILLGKSNPWIKLYDPRRVPSLKQLLTKGRDYVEEFVGAVVKNTVKY